MFSKVVRRTHMYLALFLVPWMLMYALSTMTMNHRAFFKAHYGEDLVQFETEREETYTGIFPENAGRKQIAEQILSDLDLEGPYGLRGRLDRRLTITRNDPITPRRITYTPETGQLRIEKLIFRTPVFLEQMHRRRGYQHEYALADVWAFSVDLAIVAMLFWVASGLWMWWEMKVTRRWGTVSIAGGLLLFGFFLFTIYNTVDTFFGVLETTDFVTHLKTTSM